MSLTSLDNVSGYKLPITAEEVSNGHRYTGSALYPAFTPLVEDENEDVDGIEEMNAVGPSNQHRKGLPSLSRSESRASSSHGAPSIRPGPEPTAEIEMNARKYQGYWRASFTANVPAATAMCGCILLLTGASAIRQRFVESEQAMERAVTLCDALNDAASPAKVIQTLHSRDLETMFFALKASLNSNLLPVMPAKTAFSLYQKIDEAGDDAAKKKKVWPLLAKVLKKLPQETMVPLMFLITVGRRLMARGLRVGNRSAAIYLMEGFWPQKGSRTLFASDTEAGDAASLLLLEHYDDIPDELPALLQAINYSFESGSRCNLLALLNMKKSRPELGSRSRSGESTKTF